MEKVISVIEKKVREASLIEQAIQKGFASQRTGNVAGKLGLRRLLTA